LLVLSYDNLLYVQQFLPELFHIVILLFSTGSSVLRATIHGLLINIVHSVYTTFAPTEDKEKLQSLRFLLSDFSQLTHRLHFGIGGSLSTAFSDPNPKEKKQERVILIVNLILN